MTTHDETAAILTIIDAANFSASGKKSVAAWLRRQANKLERQNKVMSKRYRARYIYQEADGCQDC